MKATFKISTNRVISGSVFTLFCLLIPVGFSQAQCTFSSGSSGADGAFIPTNSMPSTGWSVSNNVVTVTNSANGIFNFTSINISNIWTVKFTKNTLNTPVYLLAQSNVTINGTIDVSGDRNSLINGGQGGPGGYDGGSGQGPGRSVGFGPGGSTTSAGFATMSTDCCGQPQGEAYGVLDIQPMIGGSGGGGLGDGASGAGGGGGALLIATSGTLSCNGSIISNPGQYWASGSGGAIRLMANTLQGEGIIEARRVGDGSAGRIRMEACVNQRVSLSNPAATFGTPGHVFLPTNPTIRVTSIAGVATPWPPAGSLANPDTNLPSAFVNPAAISVSASNINAGTSFKIIVAPAYGTNLVGLGVLAGTYAFSTGVVTMTVYTDRVWRVNALIDYIPRP